MKLRIPILLSIVCIAAVSCDDGSGGDDLPDGDVAGDALDVLDAADDGATDFEPSDDAEPADDGEPEIEDDDGGGGCPATEYEPLTSEEIDLILSGDQTTRMGIVTVGTTEGDAFLHEPSIEVDPTDPTVRHLVSRMRVTLTAEMGVGLAAPQVGLHRRIFLAQRYDQTGRPIQVFYNPRIVEYSTETGAQMEGCISIPGANPSVRRSKYVVVDYRLADDTCMIGETIGSTTNTNHAYAARIIQHEYDHLEGVLMTDY